MSWRAPALMLVLVATLYVAARPWLVDWLAAQGIGSAGMAAIVIGAVAAMSLAIAGWQGAHRRYACAACHHEFAVSLWGHLVGQNWFGRLRATCPSCKRRDWVDPVTTED